MKIPLGKQYVLSVLKGIEKDAKERLEKRGDDNLNYVTGLAHGKIDTLEFVINLINDHIKEEEI